MASPKHCNSLKKKIQAMTAKLSDFSTVFRENFKVVVICNSTMTLPWQPSFDSIVFQICILSMRRDFTSIITYITFDLALITLVIICNDF